MARCQGDLLEVFAAVHRLELPTGEVFDALLAADLVDDVVARRERWCSVHELHRRAASGELERVQRGAVTAADHDDVEPGELVRARLDLVRDVASERTVRRRGQLLTGTAGGDDERPAVHPHAIGELDEPRLRRRPA